MEEGVDESGWGWKMPDLACWWALYNTERWKARRTTVICFHVYRKRKRWLSVGSSQGSEVMLCQHPMCRTRTEQTRCCTFPATFWAGDNVPLCCYGNAGFVVFSLPFSWADVSKHTYVRCAQALKPKVRSLHYDQPIRLVQTENKQTYSYTQLSTLGSQKSRNV